MATGFAFVFDVALLTGAFFSSKSDSSSFAYYFDLKLATEAAVLEYLEGLPELGKMLTRLPYSSVLCRVAADAPSLN